MTGAKLSVRASGERLVIGIDVAGGEDESIAMIVRVVRCPSCGEPAGVAFVEEAPCPS